MSERLVKMYYRGIGITLEKDHTVMWWSVALGKTFGPFRDRYRAESAAQDFIDTREG